MQLNKQQLVAAISAGLALTDPDSDLLGVFRRHASGILLLRAILENVGAGKLVLSPAEDGKEDPSYDGTDNA